TGAGVRGRSEALFLDCGDQAAGRWHGSRRAVIVPTRNATCTGRGGHGTCMPATMPEFGYALSSEEHGPCDLVQYAQQAETAGFDFALISDHFHPWTDKQGQSPFAWTVIGAIAQSTRRLRLGTGVTCPTVRYHPA